MSITNSITVRQLTATDLESFRELRLQGLRFNPEAFGSTFEDEQSAPPEKYSGWLANSAVFGAYQNSQLVGTASFTQLSGLKDSHKGLLRAMYVRPAARRSGAGRQLVQTIIDHARPKARGRQHQPARPPPLPILRLPSIRPRKKRSQAQRPLLRRNPDVSRPHLAR